MVRIEFRLTFEEFREGAIATQERFMKKLQAENIQNPLFKIAILIQGLAIPLGLGLLVAFKWHKGNEGLLAILAPHIFWITVIMAKHWLVTSNARKQMSKIPERSWADQQPLHRFKTVEFDDRGVRSSDQLMESSTQWTVYRTIEETPQTFLLFMSDFAYEVFPKRAFTDASAEEFRQLAQLKLARPTGGFPVITTSGQA